VYLESRRLAYLLPLTIMMSSGTEAQRYRVLKNSQQNHMVTLCAFKNLYTSLSYGHFVPLCLCAFVPLCLCAFVPILSLVDGSG
jgi:hypothetical protein